MILPFRSMIREHAREAGMPIERLGERVGYAKSTMFTFLAGGMLRVSEDRLGALAEFLEISVERAEDLMETDVRIIKLERVTRPRPRQQEEIEWAEDVVVPESYPVHTLVGTMWREPIRKRDTCEGCPVRAECMERVMSGDFALCERALRSELLSEYAFTRDRAGETDSEGNGDECWG